MRMLSPGLWLTLSIPLLLKAESPSATDQWADVASFPDRTVELREMMVKQKGSLSIPSGVYRITETLEFPLNQEKSAIVRSAGGPVTIIMDGPGPAIRISGSHEGTASPKSFQPGTWNESMPIVEGIEIVGNHPEAVGIELCQTVEPVISRVAVRWCLHGIHLVVRNRNVTISDVHLYENQGIGLYFDNVDLHQSNVSNSHISYNRQGGIVVREGGVRNLQITGCDIEANMPGDDTPTTVANILLDVTANPEDKKGSIAEVAITGCTIQHSSNYGGKDYDSLAPGGANIRILGKEIWPIDSVTITGNVVSDTSVNMDIVQATDVTISGNTFFAPNPDNLHITDSKRIVVNGNTFNPRQFERAGRIVLKNSRDCIISNCTFRALDTEDGIIEIEDCEAIQMSANVMAECPSGVVVKDSRKIRLSGWVVSDLPAGKPLVTEEGDTDHIEVSDNLRD